MTPKAALVLTGILGAGFFQMSTGAKNSPGKRPGPGPEKEKYTLFHTDNFTGTALDTGFWDYRHENETINGAVNIRSNVTLSQGKLLLADDAPAAGGFTSSQISTERHPQYWMRYGYFEIRAKLCAGVGTSCAFWLQSTGVNTVSVPFAPAENGVEIDIFENGISRNINKLFYSLHWNGYDPGHTRSITVADSIPGIYAGFHTFALEWTPRKYAVYVDDVLRASTDTMISRVPEFIVLGNGRGGFGGFSKPFPVPDYFVVDYLKLYQRNPEVTLYPESGFRGRPSEGLKGGTYTKANLAEMGLPDNALSSLEVPPGWKVVLYDGDDATGDSTPITGDTKDLQGFNDKTSSLIVREGPVPHY